MSPESKYDFEYINRHSGVRYLIKYLGDGTWTERDADFPERERVRWQVNCKKAQVRTAWRGEPYETKTIGSRGLEEGVEVWRGKPIKYIQYSCHGPSEFMIFWPAIPVKQQAPGSNGAGSRHEKCLAAVDYKGCMDYIDKN